MADVFRQPESRRQLFSTGRGVRSLTLRGSIEGAADLTEPPALNQHGGEILAEAGYDRDAIEALQSAGAWKPRRLA
jgi:crotonobetainyl-CoA:carnitine CoA-transferase CaiB-like acyl-CoA transferase